MYCATKWAGFSEDDIATAVLALGDINNFPTFIDRLEQGFLNQIVLGRLMLADNGLVTEPAFWFADGSSADRQQRARLRRQQPGRDHGHDARRHVAGLRSSGPRRVGHELLDAAPPLDRLRHLRGDLRSRRTRATSTARSCCRSSRCSGIRRRAPATSTTSSATRCPTRPSKSVLMHVAFGDHQVSRADRDDRRPHDGRRRSTGPSPPTVAAPRSSRGGASTRLEYGTATSGLLIWDSGTAPIPFEQHRSDRGRRPARRSTQRRRRPRAEGRLPVRRRH